MPPPMVTVAHPAQREVTEYAELTARLEASESVDIQARVGGPLVSVHFADGGQVRAGDLLFRIDPETYQVELSRAEAERDRMVALLDLARRELVRADQLLATRTISPEEQEQRSLRVSELESGLKAAEAAVRSAGLRLAYTEVRSPINGRMGRRLVTPGNLVAEPPFQPTLLASVVAEDPIHCYTSVEEQAFLRFQKLLVEGVFTNRIPCRVALSGETGFPHEGVIDFVDHRVDPTTGTIRVRATLANPDGRLTPGLFARIRIPKSATYTALTVPETAVEADQGLKRVLLVNADGVVEPRPVRLGPTLDGVRVVLEGLEPTDRVIVNGMARVRPGMPVQTMAATGSADVSVQVPGSGS
jgi:RND family efflux transporter MFP subunit